jgi:hypothetical protein
MTVMVMVTVKVMVNVMVMMRRVLGALRCAVAAGCGGGRAGKGRERRVRRRGGAHASLSESAA